MYFFLAGGGMVEAKVGINIHFGNAVTIGIIIHLPKNELKSC